MNETLKGVAHIGAELAAAKADLQREMERHRKTWTQLEQVKGLLREAAALSQQAEPVRAKPELVEGRHYTSTRGFGAMTYIGETNDIDGWLPTFRLQDGRNKVYSHDELPSALVEFAQPVEPAPAQDEREASHAPAWYGAAEAEAWAAGFNACLAATPLAQTEQQPIGEMISNDGDIYWTDRHPPMGSKLYTAPIAQTAPQPEQSGLVEALPYQTLFNAIAAATKSIPGTGHISISVKAFRAALTAQRGDA